MLRYLQLYEDRGLEVAYAYGQYVWDSAGRRYLDMHTGHGVAFLGHRNPKVLKALIEQMDKVVTASTSFRVRIRDEMLEALSKIVPEKFEYVYLLNSGSEAVDFALKAARKVTSRKKFVFFTNAFHGRTFGALSVTWSPKYRKPFEPLIGEVVSVKFNDVEAVERAVDRDTAAVIVELVQGEGGVNVASAEFVKSLRGVADRVGALLIVDEVQTGFGRTGRVWAFEHYNIEPDVLIAGKAMGGGFPVSAVFLTSSAASKLEVGDHGSTYGGNPLACAAVKASTEVLLEDNVPEKAFEKGSKLLSSLRRALSGLRVVRDVRGLGLMIGVELRFEPTRVLKCLQNRGLLALKAGVTVVRLLPPYMVTDEDLEFAVKVIHECLAQEDANRSTHGSAQSL